MKVRNFLLPACAAAIVVANPAVAVAPSKDSVKGNGLNNPPVPTRVARFEINASSGANGENPKGHVNFKTLATNAQTRGDVTCLNVVGDLAVIGVDITKSTTDDPTMPEAMLVYVQDNGRKTQDGAVDVIRSTTADLDEAPTVCPPPMDPDRMPLRKGEIRVEDA